MPDISVGKFLVVGGASLLGSHIGEQPLAGGAREIVLLDSLVLGSTDNTDFLLSDPRCSFIRGDAPRLNEPYDPMAQADGVFGVAGLVCGAAACRSRLSRSGQSSEKRRSPGSNRSSATS